MKEGEREMGSGFSDGREILFAIALGNHVWTKVLIRCWKGALHRLPSQVVAP